MFSSHEFGGEKLFDFTRLKILPANLPSKLNAIGPPLTLQ